ncbi:MAG TPA: tetratricopeptide repeat protein, partial [Thermoanaerobaculia bacterium]|nr:tetratricopeptide repeat protein [Thermoanaerobaculia bacterium]
MRYSIAAALLVLGATSSLQGASLKGVTLANEIGGPPVPNVQITSAGANPTASLSDGTFTLKFPRKEPGEFAELVVERKGLVVVNDFQLLQPLPKEAKEAPLTLVLAKEDEREEMAWRFYRLKSFEAIEQNYKHRITALEAKNQATTGALETARAERDQAKAMAERVAKELARLKPGSTSELFQQAFSQFLAGKPDEALNLLNEEELRRSEEAARQMKAEAEKKTKEAIQNRLLKAHISTAIFRFDEAERNYQAAIELAPDSFEAHYEFAGFDQALNRLPKALAAYTRSLELARRTGTEEDVADTLSNLGNLYRAENRTDEARHAFEEALKIDRDLAGKTPKVHRPDVALTLINLGSLHRQQNRMDDARQAYEEALKIYRELALENPAAYSLYVARSLNNLGHLDSDQNRMAEARQAYEEALKIIRGLAQENPGTYRRQVALLLNNLGVLHRDQNRMAEARQAYEEALKIRRELAQKNPETHLPDVATTLNNLGALHQSQNRLDEARQVYEETLKIFRELAQKDPDAYLGDVARTLNNLGALYRDQNRMNEARQALAEAAKTYQQLAQKDPESYLPYVAGTLNNLGALNLSENHLDEA